MCIKKILLTLLIMNSWLSACSGVGKTQQENTSNFPDLYQRTPPLYDILDLEQCTVIHIRLREFVLKRSQNLKPFQVELPVYLMQSLIEEMKTANQATGIACSTSYDLVFTLAEGTQKTLETDPMCIFVRVPKRGYPMDYELSQDFGAELKTFLQEEHPEFNKLYE